MKLLELTDPLKLRREFGFFDDFEWYVTGHRFTSLAVDAGASAAVGDAAGGVLTLTTGATLYNEAAVKTTAAVFQFAADRPLVGEWCLKYAEAAATAANVAVGFCDAAGADLLLDAGAGPKASYSGAMVYKATGATTWSFQTALGAAKTTTPLAAPAGLGVAQTIRIEAREVGGVVELVPTIDGLQATDAATGRPVKHKIALGAPALMQQFAYVKAGSAASEAVGLDYVAGYQLARVY